MTRAWKMTCCAERSKRSDKECIHNRRDKGESAETQVLSSTALTALIPGIALCLICEQETSLSDIGIDSQARSSERYEQQEISALLSGQSNIKQTNAILILLSSTGIRITGLHRHIHVRTTDAFVTVSVDGEQQLETKPVHDSLDPQWTYNKPFKLCARDDAVSFRILTYLLSQFRVPVIVDQVHRISAPQYPWRLSRWR